MSSAPWIQSSGEYRRENECVFVDGSIITHYQISLTNAAVGTRLKFHSSDRFLMRYPLDVFTSGHLRVFLLFCAFSECQWGPNIYILDSIVFYCVDLKISENIYILGELHIYKSSLSEIFLGRNVWPCELCHDVIFLWHLQLRWLAHKKWSGTESQCHPAYSKSFKPCYNKQSPAGCAQYSNSVLKCTERQKTHSVMS